MKRLKPVTLDEILLEEFLKPMELSQYRLAKEITVHIFLQAWENIQFVRKDTPFDLWLKGIAIYSILEEIRTKARTNQLKSKDKEDKPNANNPLEVMILSLPETERIIFIMHQIEGYTFQEISDFLYDYSENEIKFILRETRHKIAEALKDEL